MQWDIGDGKSERQHCDSACCCHEVLSDAFRQMRNRAAWDLNCPVVIIDARDQPPRQVQVGVGSVGGVVLVQQPSRTP